MNAELEKFCELLETTDAKQAVGVFRMANNPGDPNEYVAFCATGLFLEDVRRNDPRHYHWDGSQLVDERRGIYMGFRDLNNLLGRDISEEIVVMNDNGLSFKEIAYTLRRRFI